MKITPQQGLSKITPYVAGKPIRELKQEFGFEHVIKLASNENPIGVSSKVINAIKNTVEQINVYPDSHSQELRLALSKHYELDVEQIALGNGADDLICQILMAYTDTDDEVLTSYSSFPVYDIYSHVMRAKLVKTPLTQDYSVNLPALLEHITEKTKIIFICNPNNPTGTVVNETEVNDFIKRIPPHILVVFDEAYAEMVATDAFPNTLNYIKEGWENVMMLRTFSKVYGMAGIRLGYGFGHKNVLEPLLRVKAPFSVNLLAQAAGIAALEDQAFMHRSVKLNRQGREQLYQGFSNLGLEYVESHTNFILVGFGTTASSIHQALLSKGIIVRPCAAYGLPEFLRISIGTHEQNKQLFKLLKSILER
ncbi:MAG: histidinol-phosphate transaminase [Thiotrichaceae bacterium]|nr:histidinol-phosphate transaminase [Thiotrichaceae bacterium]